MAGYTRGSGRRLRAAKPSPHTRTHTLVIHTRIALISLEITDNLRKKKIQLLIWKRGGRGETQCREGKILPVSPFPAPRSIVVEGMGVSPGAPSWTSVREGLAAIPHLTINLWKMQPVTNSLNLFLRLYSLVHFSSLCLPPPPSPVCPPVCPGPATGAGGCGGL